MKKLRAFIIWFFCLLTIHAIAQEDSGLFRWDVSSKKIADHQYQIIFRTKNTSGYVLYAPNQNLDGFNTAEIKFEDSAAIKIQEVSASGNLVQFKNPLFSNVLTKGFNGATEWTVLINVEGRIPGQLAGTLLYTYGKGGELYPSTSYSFSTALEGGENAFIQIRRPTIDVNNPLNSCGDNALAGKSLWTLFLIGAVAGFLALFFPCIFPLIPMTVSFFTKRSKTKRQGVANAFLYGGSIFLIYTLISLPFHLFNIEPQILNSISTNVPVNITFFLFFVVFAISFFGYFEITLPSSFANKADSKAGLGNFIGIFFMALTLAIVSFSCTSGILGALLFGSLSGSNGAWQLTAGMAGFGLGLGLPFVLFALFPNWLQSLPKSGGWMNELKVVFGFIELAMAFKFLSNADLVKQWHLLEREVFIGSWIAIGLATVLYLCGVFRFSGDGKPKFTAVRIFFIALFSLVTVYLIPGLTNTKRADLELISGFPPPFNYSVYKPSINYQNGVKPLENDYEKALQLAKEQNKPVLIDFTGWACVNCRRMEEKVWTNPEVRDLMNKRFIVVSLYVDERRLLPSEQRGVYNIDSNSKKLIQTVGNRWATFQAVNFKAVSQPQYAIISPDEIALTRTKAYTPDPVEFATWLRCGLDANKQKTLSKN